jgi:hypothetical protein
MDQSYFEILQRKIHILRKDIGFSNLNELGIDRIIISYVAPGSQPTNMFSGEGELLFLLSQNNRIYDEKVSFENVIIHEVMHGYVSNCLTLNMDEKKERKSYVEMMIFLLAEDIQLTKFCNLNNIKSYMEDEVRRDNSFYKKLLIPSKQLFKRFPPETYFSTATSAAYSLAKEKYLLDSKSDSHTKKIIKKNISIIKRHAGKIKAADLSDSLHHYFDKDLARTAPEKENFLSGLLDDCDKWIIKKNLNIF